MKSRRTILVVDDEELSRELIRQIFGDEYDIMEAADGREAIHKLSEHLDEIAVVLLDLVMPELNGLQVLQVLKARELLSRIPVVLITAQKDTAVELNCFAMGASAVISKPFVSQAVRMQVNNLLEIHRTADEMENTIQTYRSELEAQQEKLNVFYDKLLDAIANIVEFRDLETGEHIQRVKSFTRVMANAMRELYPEKGLTKQQIDTIVRASVLHDIGKIAVPDNILLKPGRLTGEERKVMMNHTVKGCEILNLIEGLQDGELLRTCYDICRYHHERYDGAGYPEGLRGDEIPLSAQIVSVVDVYDALVSERVYKKAYDPEVAYDMIADGECGAFSPEILECLEYSREALKAISDLP
ncbi:MAG: response regulator [Clostridium sp.]|nr:response regulator [Acetatifactor muris]MCM1525773.1 response regulator [Bacteroides sp.]MCM1564073.1 response regulator [Clostridium sp.]